MEKPSLASQEIFDIMLSCWYLVPETRPLFDQLQMKLAALLDDEVTSVSWKFIEKHIE